MRDRVALVGVDWADKRHAFEVRGVDGTRRRGQFDQRPEAVHAWVADLRVEYPKGTIAVAIEQSRGGLLYALTRYDFLELLPLQPSRTAGYRRFVRPSGAKNDPTDAGLICDYVEKHGDEIRSWRAADAVTRELLLLVEWRRKLIEQRVAASHQIRDTLKQYFPQALDWIGELTSPMALDFLERWPTLDRLQRSKRASVRSFYTTHGSRSGNVVDRRVGEIDKAVALHSDQALLSALSMIVLSLVPVVRTLSRQIQCFDRRIAELWTDHPDHELFESFPGAGAVLAPRLAVALGTDRLRWTAASLQAFSGVAPVTIESGASRWVHSRWSCPKFLRQTFHEFAACSIAYCRWAQLFYEHQRARGKGRHAAIRALAFRWMRIIVRCWRDRIPYEDQRYVRRLIASGAPIATGLAP